MLPVCKGAVQRERFPAGTIEASPYSGFNTGQTVFNNSLVVSMTHAFSASFVSETKVDFNRF